MSAILGPEMAAPILWTPGKLRPFCRKNHVHKIPRFRGGGGILGLGGEGGEVPILFLWETRILLKCGQLHMQGSDIRVPVPAPAPRAKISMGGEITGTNDFACFFQKCYGPEKPARKLKKITLQPVPVRKFNVPDMPLDGHTKA